MAVSDCLDIPAPELVMVSWKSLSNTSTSCPRGCPIFVRLLACLISIAAVWWLGQRFKCWCNFQYERVRRPQDRHWLAHMALLPLTDGPPVTSTMDPLGRCWRCSKFYTYQSKPYAVLLRRHNIAHNQASSLAKRRIEILKESVADRQIIDNHCKKIGSRQALLPIRGIRHRSSNL